MNLEQALIAAHHGQAILFLGAGFSRGAITQSGQVVPTAAELAALLIERGGLNEGLGLEDAAELFVEQRNADELVQLLKEVFTAATVTDAQRSLMEYPWKRIYTTNFDNVAEAASRAVGKPRKPVVPNRDVETLRVQPDICVHLNGYIGALSAANLWDEFKLTDPSYLRDSLNSSPWMTVFRNDIRSSQAAFFVGYSLTYDLDVRRVLFSAGPVDKCFFFVGPSPSPQTTLRASRAGSMLKESSEWLSAELERTKPIAAAQPVDLPLTTFELYKPPQTTNPLKDSDVFNLFVFGIEEAGLTWSTLHDASKRYTLDRGPFSAICDDIVGTPGVFVLHADLGNGKTIALQLLKAKLTEAHREVYSLRRDDDQAMSEMESILRNKPDCVLMIDSYGNSLDLVEHYSLHKTSESRLVLTARSTTHDVLSERLVRYVRAEGLREYDLNRLSRPDVEWLVDSFEQYGLWGRLAGASRDVKIRHLKGKCESEFHAILLDLLESESILKKLQDLAKSLSESSETLDLVVATLTLTVLQLHPEVHDLVNVLSPAIVRRVSLRSDQAVRQLFDFDKNFIRIRSAVSARFLLTRVLDENEVTARVIRLFKVVATSSDASHFYTTAATQMMRFGEIQRVLPPGGHNVFHYYESIKDQPPCQGNPLFWLHYAIAALSSNELDRAGKYFSTAYSLAESRSSFNTYQIDNHYARYLLMRASRMQVDKYEAMADFREAHTIITRQIHSGDNLYYPFRVAGEYAPFLDRWQKDLEAAEIDELRRAALHALEIMQKLPGQERFVHHTREARARLESVVKRTVVPAAPGGNA